MSIKYIKFFMWVLCAIVFVAVGMSMTLAYTQSVTSVEKDTVYDPLPDAPEDAHEANEYKEIIVFPFAYKKPPPPVVRVTGLHKVVAQSPFELMKVAPDGDLAESHFQLSHKITAEKAWYKEGDDLYERNDSNFKKVGEIKELQERKTGKTYIYTVVLTYNGKEFTTSLDVQSEVQPLVADKKKWSLKKSLQNLRGLAVYEGRQIGASSYVLNKDFFDAMMANGISEIDKLEFDGANPMKIASMGKQSVLRKFGLRENDTLVNFGGKKLKTVSDVQKAMVAWQVNKKNAASFSVLRNGKQVDYKFTVENNAGKYKEHFQK